MNQSHVLKNPEIEKLKDSTTRRTRMYDDTEELRKVPRQAQRYKWKLRRQKKNNYKGQWVFSERGGTVETEIMKLI